MIVMSEIMNYDIIFLIFPIEIRRMLAELSNLHRATFHVEALSTLASYSNFFQPSQFSLFVQRFSMHLVRPEQVDHDRHRPPKLLSMQNEIL